MTHIAIFASGNGSNAENIIRYFNVSPESRNRAAEVNLVVSNRADAFVLERAARLDVPAMYLKNSGFRDPDIILPLLKEYRIDLIVLAGFLLMIPPFLIEAFPGRIVNIHPSLLPKFGGKGMYGHHVHEAVVAAGEKETGITIHYVSEECDRGEQIFQASFPIHPGESVESVEVRIHELEQRHFPEIIESIIR